MILHNTQISAKIQQKQENVKMSLNTIPDNIMVVVSFVQIWSNNVASIGLPLWGVKLAGDSLRYLVKLCSLVAVYHAAYQVSLH